MVHILFLILKIIGIVLLILLGLLLLLLAALLFVPVRYRGRICKPEEGLEKFTAGGRISWLLRILTLEAQYENGRLQGAMKVFGVSVRKFGERAEEKVLSHADPLEEDRGAGEAAEDPQQTEEEQRQSVAGEQGSPAAGEQEQAEDRQQTAERPPESGKRAEKESVTVPGKVHFLSRAGGKAAAFFRLFFLMIGRLFGIPQRIAKMAERLRKKMNRLKKSFHYWKKFLTSEPFREGMKLLFSELRGLLKAICPRKVKGDFVFGFDDPSVTGQTLGLLSLCAPALTGEFRVIPVFERQILRLDLEAAGRIYGITLLRAFWRLFRDRNVRFIYRKIRGGSKG